MNVGEFKDKISILALTQNENIYSWEPAASIWAKAEDLKGTNLFSKVGLGAKSVKFTIRKRSNFDLHKAIQWKDKHCFLTDIIEINRMYFEVTAALVEPKSCIIEQSGQPSLDELNRPIYDSPELLTFPGCLIEKYIGHVQEAPMASTETRYVLVTPKIISLEPGEIVVISNINYEVLIPHTLDDYKNEYEILAKGDA